MKTVADLKRKLTTPGAQVTLKYDRGFNGKPHRYIGTTRTIECALSRSIRFASGSYLDYPKKEEVFFIDSTTFAILNEGKIILVYEFVENHKSPFCPDCKFLGHECTTGNMFKKDNFIFSPTDQSEESKQICSSFVYQNKDVAHGE